MITSVDRDDLRDGGAGHFVDCIRAVRAESPATQIESLVPDFRGRLERALGVIDQAPPDVMNHNLETVPRLYKQARPGSDYAHSLSLLQSFKRRHPDIPTKSGLMVGLGETDDEILATLRDLRVHDVDMLTIGQYLQPTKAHLPVARYVHPDRFAMFEREAYALGFRHAAVGALVRSSYHADRQAEDVLAALPINSLLPHRLARLCNPVRARLIHVSTDCVFSGSRGMYFCRSPRAQKSRPCASRTAMGFSICR